LVANGDDSEIGAVVARRGLQFSLVDREVALDRVARCTGSLIRKTFAPDRVLARDSREQALGLPLNLLAVLSPSKC
jgi:hypothetical protein